MSSTPSETFGPYYGSDIDFQTGEILAVANIPHKLLAEEARLYGLKWFDYRTLHPTQATYLLTHFYNRAYGGFMAIGQDRRKKFMAGFKGKDFMQAREKLSFWRLRQRVDELGIRYDFFMRAAMDWCLENGWRQPPRPSHIATNADMIVDVTNRWEMECRAKIQFALSPRFSVEEFVGAPDQLAYEEYLICQIMKRPHPKYALHTALYLNDALRIETALARLPVQAVSDAVDFRLER